MENLDHLNISEERIMKLFGEKYTLQIKASTALICKIHLNGKHYYIGYNDYKKRFYTASILPDEI